TAGTQSITVTDTTSAGLTGTEGGIAVKAGASQFLMSAPSSVTAGVAFSLTLTVTGQDAYGNVVPGYTGTVHLTSTDPQAVLPANYTFTAADAGKHTFIVTLKTAGTRSITVADTLNSALTVTQGGITVYAAAARTFTTTAPSTVKVGSPFTLTLTVQDAYGNVVTDYTGTVRFTSTDRSATLPANYTFLAADQGVHTFTGLILRK